MFFPQSLWHLLNVISSPESVAGPTPSGLLDGPTTVQCGLGLVHANLSARQGKAQAWLINATCGPLGSGSSESVALSQSLVSRLQQRFGTDGTMLFRQTWKRKATPSGRVYWAHTASALRTSGNGYISLRTYWPTPTAVDRVRNEESMKKCQTIRKARANQNTVPIYLGEAAQLTILNFGTLPTGFPVKTGSQGQLNPAFSLWLMGYPAEWASCGERAMRLCRKSRRNS